MKIYHAHDVLHFLADSDKERSISEIQEVFGEDARFKNCQEVLFTIDELIAFLSSRGKINMTSNGISVEKENICNHS